MSLSYGEENQLGAPTADDLVSAIRRFGTSDLQAYRQRKSQLLDEVGYEETRGAIDISFEVPEAYQDRPEELLVDLALGLVKDLELKDASAWDVRFNLRSPHPEIEIPSGSRLELRPTEDPVPRSMILRGLESGREVRVSATVRTAGGVLPAVNPDSLKLRVDFDGGHLIVARRSGRSQITFDLPDPGKPVRLDKAGNIAKVVQFFHGVLTERRENVEVFIDAKYLVTLADMNLQLPEVWRRWAALVTLTRDVLFDAGAPPECEIVVEAAAGSIEDLEMAQAVLRRSGQGIQAKFTVDQESPLYYERNLAYPLLIRVDLGKVTVLVAAVLIGPLQRGEKPLELRFTATEALVVRRQVALADDPALPEDEVILRQLLEIAPEDALVVTPNPTGSGGPSSTTDRDNSVG